MYQLPLVSQDAQAALAAVEFNEGHRYADYLPGTDKAASDGLAGLVVGAAAVKGGFFNVLLVSLLAFKKVLRVGVVALIAAVKRLFGGGSHDQPTEAV